MYKQQEELVSLILKSTTQLKEEQEHIETREQENIKIVVDKCVSRLFDHYINGRIDEDEFNEYSKNIYAIVEDEVKRCAARIENKLGVKRRA